MRKVISLLLILLSFTIVSCSKSPRINNEQSPRRQDDIGLPDIAKHKSIRVRESLQAPKSFLQDANFNIPQAKTYYTGKAVVLTYHHISSKPFSSITIKPERFESDIKMLKDNYFNVISLRDMINAVMGNAKLPPNAVVITFDDGIGSFYKYAYPVLKKYNFPAVNFVITSRTESYSPSDDDFNPLGPDQIREMYKSSLIDIQSHSHDGHQYVTRNEEGKTGGYLAYRIYDKNTKTYESVDHYNGRVVDDLEKSIAIIQKYTDNKPDILCFPYGHYNSNLVDLGRKAGFNYFVTTAYGYNKEGSKTAIIKRIRSGDSNLTTSKLMQNIINCGQGKSQDM